MQRPTRFSLACWYCRETGHILKNCPTKILQGKNGRKPPNWYTQDSLRSIVEGNRGYQLEGMGLAMVYTGNSFEINLDHPDGPYQNRIYPTITFSKGQPLKDSEYLNYYSHERVNSRTIYMKKWNHFRNNTYIFTKNKWPKTGFGYVRLVNADEDLQIKKIQRFVKNQMNIKYGTGVQFEENIVYPDEYPTGWVISARANYGKNHLDYYGYDCPNFEPNVHWDELDSSIENNFFFGKQVYNLLNMPSSDTHSCLVNNCYDCYFMSTSEKRLEVFRRKLMIKERILRREATPDFMMIALDYNKKILWGETLEAVDENHNLVNGQDEELKSKAEGKPVRGNFISKKMTVYEWLLRTCSNRFENTPNGVEVMLNDEDSLAIPHFLIGLRDILTEVEEIIVFGTGNFKYTTDKSKKLDFSRRSVQIQWKAAFKNNVKPGFCSVGFKKDTSENSHRLNATQRFLRRLNNKDERYEATIFKPQTTQEAQVKRRERPPLRRLSENDETYEATVFKCEK